jgi:GNAT superfamily N-acetyltransferase
VSRKGAGAAAEGPHLVRREELDDLADLMQVCFWGGAPRERRRGRGRHVDRGGAWIVARDGRPVSHIRIVYNTLSLYGSRVKIASIGGVCTHPDYRKQGIASELLEHCMQVAVEAGASLMLISGRRGLYRRAMAVDAAPMFGAKIERGSVERRAGGPTARPARPEDWGSCARLHQAEPVRFERPGEFFARALGGHWHRVPWVIEAGGEVVAYLTLSRDWGEPRESPQRWVSEYAGVRAALVEGLPSLMEAAELEGVQFRAPRWDRELADRLRAEGLRLSSGTLWEHTIRLLDLPMFMRKLRPYAAARLPRAELRALAFEQTAEGCVFRQGEESLELDVGKATALVLGGPAAPKLKGEAGKALGRLFPIPFPLPGMNYV